MGVGSCRDSRPLYNRFKPNVAVLDLHRRADVDLDAEQAFHPPQLRIIVDHLAHHSAVQHVDEDVAARDDVDIVPLVALRERLKFGERAGRPDDLARTARDGVGDLTAHRHERAPALFVQVAGVAIRAVEIELIALHRPRRVGNLDAAVVDAAVALRRHPELELQLEVLRRRRRARR